MGGPGTTLAGLGATLLIVALLAALLNVRAARGSHPGWLFGSVWSPLLPATLGTLTLAYDVLKCLVSALP